MLIGACSSANVAIAYTEKNPVITMSRTGCFGACPTYAVTIRGNGMVEYQGYANVKHIGSFTTEMTNNDIDFIVKEMKRISFFGLKNKYWMDVSDAPTTTLTYTLNDSTKSVEDYFGAPSNVKDMERTIDSLVNRLEFKQAPAK